MKCPVDKIEMIVVEHQKIELDYCHRCGGVWFDSGELDLLAAALKQQDSGLTSGDLLTPSEAKVDESRRKCPICGKKMDKVWVGRDPKVLIDSCPIGDGLWFDGGELHQVIVQLQTRGLTGQKDILSFLGNAFQADNMPK
jgi:Zn-finger nucleic acid-binding protein